MTLTELRLEELEREWHGRKNRSGMVISRILDVVDEFGKLKNGGPARYWIDEESGLRIASGFGEMTVDQAGKTVFYAEGGEAQRFVSGDWEEELQEAAARARAARNKREAKARRELLLSKMVDLDTPEELFEGYENADEDDGVPF